MRFSIIVAMARNFVIGNESGMPWRLPTDMKRFRQLTMNKPVILGRKTLDLLPAPLPGRPNVVLTRNLDLPNRGIHIARTVETARSVATNLAQREGVDEVMVIGGAEIYKQFLDHVDRIYLTIVDAEPVGSAMFPRELLTWGGELISEAETIPADNRNEYPHRYVILERPIKTEPPPLRPPASSQLLTSMLYAGA